MQQNNDKKDYKTRTGIKNESLNFPLDTLVQLPPNTKQVKLNKSLKKDSVPLTPMQKRARSKMMTKAFAAQLAQRPSALKKSYLHSLNCASILHQHNNKITGKYCNQRWCIVCARIRTANLINGYMPQLKELKNKYFVTLTVPNCEAKFLEKTIQEFYKAISLINRNIREKKKIKFQGLRKFECTYNLEENTYHPHIHMIVDSYSVGALFIDQWLSRFPNAKRIAQHITEADDNACLELFKYFTKIVAKTGKDETRVIRGVHTESLDTIFLSVRGMRTFQGMGLKKQVCEDIKELQAVQDDTIQAQSALWEWIDNDWCDTSTGEILSGYVPSEAVKKLCDNVL